MPQVREERYQVIQPKVNWTYGQIQDKFKITKEDGLKQ